MNGQLITKSFLSTDKAYIIMKDSIIIVSGGMDSVTLLYEMKERIALGISFDYGSNHNKRR